MRIHFLPALNALFFSYIFLVVFSVNPDRAGDRCPRCDASMCEGSDRVVPTIDACPKRSFHVHQDEVQELRVTCQAERAAPVYFPPDQYSRLEMQLRVQQSNVGGVAWVSAWTDWVLGINIDQVRSQLQGLAMRTSTFGAQSNHASDAVATAANELRQMMENVRVLRLPDAGTNDLLWLFTFQSTAVPGGVCATVPDGRMEFPRLEARLRIRGGHDIRSLNVASHSSSSGGSSSSSSSSIPRRWEIKFQLLQKYVEEHGNARVLRDLDTATYPKLGVWVNSQRMARRAELQRACGQIPKCLNRINDEQVAKLDGIGFLWSGESHAVAWEQKFEMLRSFIREYKHARVPARLSVPRYRGLGQWVMAMRRAYRMEQMRSRGQPPTSSDRIAPEQIARLDSVGFLWSVGRERPHTHTHTGRRGSRAEDNDGASSADMSDQSIRADSSSSSTTTSRSGSTSAPGSPKKRCKLGVPILDHSH